MKVRSEAAHPTGMTPPARGRDSGRTLGTLAPGPQSAQHGAVLRQGMPMPPRHLLFSALLATLTATLASCGGSASGEHFSVSIDPPRTCPSAPCVTTVAGSGDMGNAN